MKDNLPGISILGVEVTSASENEVLEFIIKGLKTFHKKWYIVTLNPEILVFANKYPRFGAVLNNARLGLADGIGVVWAGKILGENLKERVTGVDLMENLCKRAEEEGLVVGFLGGGPKIALKTAECLKSRYPKLRVGFVGEEWRNAEVAHDPPKATQLRAGVSSPRSDTIDILFVAFGFPKQELWIAQNLKNLPVKMAMGVGGAFDFICGQVPRAPKWVQAVGLEWLFRLIVQPWRLRRQLTLIEFVYLVLKERLRFVPKPAIL